LARHQKKEGWVWTEIGKVVGAAIIIVSSGIFISAALLTLSAPKFMRGAREEEKK
jgi:hypothetical protein